MVTLSPARERATLLVLALIQFTHVIDFMIMMPLGPQLMSSLHLTPAQFSRVVASYGFSAGVCGFVATFVMDRFDRKRSLLSLYAGFAVATLLCALAPTYPMLLLARVLAGAFGGVAGSVVVATVGDVVPREGRGAGMAIVMSGFSIAQILGVPVGLWLAAGSDWHAPFFVLSGLAVLINGVGLFVLPSVAAHLAVATERNGWRRLREIVAVPNHLCAFSLVALLTLSGMIVVPFLATAVERNGGFSERMVMLVYMCGGVATLVTNNVLGRLGDRFGHQRVFLITALLAVVPVLAVAQVGPWPAALLLLATTAFIMSMGARWTPSMALVTMAVPSRMRGGFMSLNSAVQALFGACGAGLAGLIVREAEDGRLENFFWAGVASLGFLAGAAFFIRRLRVIDETAVPRPPAVESGVAD